MRAIQPLLLASGLLGPGLVAFAACGGGDRCVTIVDRQIECAPTEQRAHLTNARERTLTGCRARSGNEPAAEEEALACAEQRSCDEVRRCNDAIKDRDYAHEVTREIEAALASGERREEALSTCRVIDLKDEGVQQRCGQLFAQALAAAIHELEQLRDGGGARPAPKG